MTIGGGQRYRRRPAPPGGGRGSDECAVAAVHDAHGHVVGAAFLVDGERLLTCAHVVTAALGLGQNAAYGPAPEAPVRLTFPLTDPARIFHAEVLTAQWQPIGEHNSGDIAVLRLQRPPEGVHPVHIGTLRPLWTRMRRCLAFGFPQDRRDGRWYEGRIVRPVGGGLVQLVRAHRQGYEIEEGFSGSPVWDTRSRRVVGMVVSVDVWGQRQHTYRPAAFMIPTHRLPVRLRPGWPALVAGWRRARERRERLPAAVTTVAKLLTVVLATGLAVLPEPRSDDCAHPVEVRVATSPEHLDSYRMVARTYERWTARHNGGCRTANLYVFPAAPELVARGIEAGWVETGDWAPRDAGPHPDVWLPGAGADRADIPTRPWLASSLIAQSPLVLGVPHGRVDEDRDGGHRRATLSWPDLFHKATRSADASRDGVTGAGWGVIRPDPTVSVAGRIATAELYYGDGAQRETPPPRRRGDPARVRQEVERWIERAQDAARYPPGDVSALLCRQRRLAGTTGGPGPAAVIATEQALIEFNRGLPLGAGCPERDTIPDAARLDAFYPRDTPWLDHYLIRPAWPGPVQSRAARDTAADFQTWLVERDAGRTAIRAAGLHVPVLLGNFPYTEADGVLPAVPLEDPPANSEPAPTQAVVRQQALRLHADATRPGRVLLAVDSSGSMLRAAGDRNRFEVALDGIEASLRRMGGRDEFGLWTFSTAAGGAHRQVRPLGRRDEARDAAVLAGLRRSTPAGDTPLYRTIDAGIRRLLRAGGDPGQYLQALVLLTDGRDTASGRLVPDLSHGSRVRVFVIAIGEATCADRFHASSLDEVTSATGGQCVEVAADRVDRTLVSLFGRLWETGAAR